MSNETENKLHAMLEQEFGAIALQSDMQGIEYIVCADDIKLLSKARTDIRACYNVLGIVNSPVLTAIDARLDGMLAKSQ